MGTPIETADLLRRIEAIERRLQMALQPFTVWPSPNFQQISVTCSKCGVKWDGAMGYVCGTPDCPIQPKVTC